MNQDNISVPSVEKLLEAYDLLVKGIELTANEDKERAFGGVIRSGKGQLVESLAYYAVRIAWNKLGQDASRISTNSKKIRIPLNKDYIQSISSPDVKKWINENIHSFYYGLSTDIHVFIDDKFIMGIECKAYTENAMLKRILVDFTLLKSIYPAISSVLFQLESQLGGDYSNISKNIIYGSTSSHTIMSYFDVDLIIMTLLEGERKVDKPIHNADYFKTLSKDSLENSINTFMDILRQYA